MVFNRTIEGETTLSLKCAISIAEFVPANIMVVGVIIAKMKLKREKEKERKRRKDKGGKDDGDDGQVRESRTDG
jgi:hypothetical protein